jgi:hypothetical protein
VKIPSIDFLDSKDDRQTLLGFLSWLEKLFGALVEESQGPKDPLFANDLPGDLRKAILEAWDEIGERGTFAKVIIEQSEIPGSVLAGAGLTGKQLSFKLRVLRWICEKFEGHRSSGWLRRVLKAVDDILDSIASVNPLAHALKEFKDALSSLTE